MVARWITRCLIAGLSLACLGLLIFAPRSDILTTITIAAPPKRVWAILTDTNAYPSWNPMISALKGELAPGAVIENDEGYGKDRTVFWPVVLTAQPGRELRWRGHLWDIPHLFDGTHYFVLRPDKNGTLFTQGEHFTGVLLWIFDAQQLVPWFQRMNVALKHRAEAAT